MRKKITWLHLSDIHFCNNHEWRDNTSRNLLIDHLKNLFKDDESLKPDFIFCTGDIAFGERADNPLKEQYQVATLFFDQLLLICGDSETTQSLSKDRLFVVPGNHDINRRSINSDAQSCLQQWSKTSDVHVTKINQRFNDRTTEFKDAIKRLDEYGQFVKNYLPHQYDIEGRFHYANIVNIDGLKVGIAGINSAWTCSGPEDDRNIWLAANWQFNSAQIKLKEADLRIGLMHHPIDWLNSSEREMSNKRISSDFDFWLHGHCHNAWVSPLQSHIVIAAGAVGAENNEEFGINITTIDLFASCGTTHLFNKGINSNGWTIAPIHDHAPLGKWKYKLPEKNYINSNKLISDNKVIINTELNEDFINRYLNKNLDISLISFGSQPKVWVSPVISTVSEVSKDAKSVPKITIESFISNPKSTFVKAPPQYGLTCFARYLCCEAWRIQKSLWLYLDAKNINPHLASITDAVTAELNLLGCDEKDIKCIVLDSWNSHERDLLKLLKNLCVRFRDVPIFCMQQTDGNKFALNDNDNYLDREFEVLFLWSLPRDLIRKLVVAYNDTKSLGDEDLVTKRIISDLDVLNLHRTPMNCLTLLKVSEVDFDESPVNRSEMIKRVLFLLFNVDDIPTYKTKPDLKDCEYVLGYFSELLMRENSYLFSRDRFLLEVQKHCQNHLIDLDTHVVFDVLYSNNIFIKRANLFTFKFSYWLFYFAAQRMHHDQDFANFIFEDMRYVQYPELIELYTGIDRRREDALNILIKDIKVCSTSVKENCGFPEDFNPYQYAKWTPSQETKIKMHEEIKNGVLDSNLPSEIKDQFADRNYDQTKPYDQTIKSILNEKSFLTMLNAMKAGARALRNSDYVKPEIKRSLLREIMNCWEQASRVLFVVLPTLAEEGYATYDNLGILLVGNFGESVEQRFFNILNQIPGNVASWCNDDLFSQKMGPLLFDQLESKDITDICKHELILFLIQHRPRNWNKHVQRYIVSKSENSYYLMDVYSLLRSEYKYGYASNQTLIDIEHLIKVVAAKHITGVKDPGIKTLNKLNFKKDLIPTRVDNE